MLFLMFWHEKDVEYAFQPAHLFMVVCLKSVHYVDKELNKFNLVYHDNCTPNEDWRMVH